MYGSISVGYALISTARNYGARCGTERIVSSSFIRLMKINKDSLAYKLGHAIGYNAVCGGAAIKESLDSVVRSAADSVQELAHNCPNVEPVTRDTIADVASGLGAGANEVRALLAQASTALDEVAQQARAEYPQSANAMPVPLASLATEGAASAASAVVDCIGWVADNAQRAFASVAKNADLPAAAVRGALDGTVSVIGGTLDAYAIDESEIAALRSKFLGLLARDQILLGRHLAMTRIAEKQRGSRLLNDLLTVGGLTLSEIADAGRPIPETIATAWRYAYPQLANRMSFADAVHNASQSEAVGYAQAVKGKLFEIRYVEYLNNDHLPEGWHASIAESASQPGWDIQILDASGHVHDLLQAKATESVGYVEDALRHYPDIDVVTTSEVHAQLALRHGAEHVLDSDLPNAALTAEVASSIDHASDHSIAWIGGTIASLGITAFSVFGDKGKSIVDQSRAFTDRATQSVAASGAGKVMMMASNLWWLALAGAVGGRLVWSNGACKRAQLEDLRQLIANATEVVLRVEAHQRRVRNTPIAS